MSRIRRIGLRPDPPGGWPLDQILVGVATLRTLRELSRSPTPLRPWDFSLQTGVSPQGTADALKRLLELGLVAEHPSSEAGRASRYRIEKSHFLREPLGWLFAAERDEVQKLAREARRNVIARDGSAKRGSESAPRGPRG